MSPRTAVALLLLLPAMPLAAQRAVPQSDNLMLRGAAVFLVVIMIWMVLYNGVYPFFHRYYRDEFCKTIFWNLFFLYTLTWVFVSFYVVLDIGFYWAWLPWVSLFLGVWWLISGAVLLLRPVPA